MAICPLERSQLKSLILERVEAKARLEDASPEWVAEIQAEILSIEAAIQRLKTKRDNPKALVWERKPNSKGESRWN